jgi:hypothetical protein
MIRYYGVYANAHRGKMRKTGVDVFHVPIIEDMDRYVPSKGWAEMTLLLSLSFCFFFWSLISLIFM